MDTTLTVNLEYSDAFLKEAKLLTKHYPSFKNDLQDFIKELRKNPLVGDDLGEGFRKVRMAIASKGKGKSGGARVITLNIIIATDTFKVILAYIYDKNKASSISKKDIKAILFQEGLIK